MDANKEKTQVTMTYVFTTSLYDSLEEMHYFEKGKITRLSQECFPVLEVGFMPVSAQ